MSNILIFSNKIFLGNSYLLHANGLGRSSATPLFSFLKIPAVALALRALMQEGKNSFPPTPFLFARLGYWILKFGIRIFLKESSNFVQKAQPTFTFSKIISFCPCVLRLLMVFFRYNPGIFKITGQRAVGNAEVPALKRRENKVFQNQSFFFRL